MAKVKKFLASVLTEGSHASGEGCRGEGKCNGKAGKRADASEHCAGIDTKMQSCHKLAVQTMYQ